DMPPAMLGRWFGVRSQGLIRGRPNRRDVQAVPIETPQQAHPGSPRAGPENVPRAAGLATTFACTPNRPDRCSCYLSAHDHRSFVQATPPLAHLHSHETQEEVSAMVNATPGIHRIASIGRSLLLAALCTAGGATMA